MTAHPGQKRKLTLAILARNCAEELSETLVSLRNVADEILVLDTGSTDDTASIAEKLGAKVYHRPWEDSFSAARNHLQIRASGDFILWMDAGETLSRDHATLLREFVNEEAQVNSAYQLRISMPRVNEFSAGEQVARIRLIPNRPGLLWTGLVRESLERSLFSFGMEVEPLPIVMERSAREQDAARRMQKARRNVELADLQIARGGPTADMYNCLGEALQTRGQYQEAAKYYQQAKELATKESTELLESYYGMLACLDYVCELPMPDRDLGTPAAAGREGPARETQIAICLEAMESFPLDAQLLVALGGYLQSVGKCELAQRSYEVAFEHGQITTELWYLPDIREIAATGKAVSLRSMGRDSEATTWLCAAQKELPHSVRLGQLALDAQVSEGNAAEALAIAYGLPGTFPQRELVPTAVEGAVLAWRGSWQEAIQPLQRAFSGGLRQRWSIRWYAKTLCATGDVAKCDEVLSIWESIEPNHPEQTRLREQVRHSAQITATKRAGFQRVDPGQTGTMPQHFGNRVPSNANQVVGHTNYLGTPPNGQ